MSNRRRIIFPWMPVLVMAAFMAAWVTGVPLAAPDARPAAPPEADLCRADLAARLHIDVGQVRTTKTEAVEFPDSSFGFPRPGELYAQVVTPGFRLVLEAPQGHYLYGARGKTVRYGGPLAAWTCSALYVEPVENEANLNGDLVQVSLAGTNPRVVMHLVNGFYPQDDGSVFGTRRTSRSGHDLLFQGPDAKGEPVLLAAAFDFGEAVISPDGAKWAAFSRPRVGMPWELTVGSVKTPAEHTSLELPAKSAPHRLYWTQAQPVVTLRKGSALVSYELAAGGAWKKLERFMAPDAGRMMLNKSETLEVRQDGTGVRISKVWFNGDVNPVTVLPDFTLREAFLSPSLSCVLVTGRSGDALVARTVDLASGEVLPTVAHGQSDVKLYAMPPKAVESLRGLLETPGD